MSLEHVAAELPRRLNADTVIELLRQLMERQALRRIEGGSLTDEEVERLGRTFLALSERMEELKDVFGLEDKDLNLNLGPLGDLL
jgi:hypothetical protein